MRSVTICVNNKFEINFFQNLSRIFKGISVKGFKTLHTVFTRSKKSSMLYFKYLLEIGGRLVQIEQALQIGTKLLQIGAAPVVTNQGNIYYKLKQNYYKLGQLLQIAA